MIPKPFDQISDADIQFLLDQKIAESKTLEYKRDLPDNSDKAKHSFLAAIASLANTDGGDILYGIDALDGIPINIPGVGDVIEDQLRLRLESMIRSGIEPRLPKLELRLIPVANGIVLLVRATKSWAAPHRVTVRDSGPFYARHSSGKYELDVAELRAAFALSDTITQRIEHFRNERLLEISNYSTAVKMRAGCKMVLHIIPLSAFAGREPIDMLRFSDILQQFHPLGRTHFQNTMINLEGVVDYSNKDGAGDSHAYTQIYRSGVVEAAQVLEDKGTGRLLHSYVYEQHVWSATERYLSLLGKMGISAPFYIFLSFVAIDGYSFAVPNDGYGYISRVADRHTISLPGIVVTDPTLPAPRLLRPAFDMVWNAFGYPASQNYDATGDWITRR
ncbi:helix-turn-helix domain-containing protein [Collimonas humicola]|uniref:AlbA family DNA-binding domain-containing protein n=1 Tax=Collimonas humicola TaxID=2825886 RepID=UPI001B8AF5F7|nr:ATP-binding protein [Collimonas humicola]